MNNNEPKMTGERAAILFAEGLTAKWSGDEWPRNPEFSADLAGKKYIMIVNEGCPSPKPDEDVPLYRRPRSVHAYVDRETGAVYKAAGWKTGPVKDKTGKPSVRFENVFEALVKADPFGSYLYK